MFSGLERPNSIGWAPAAVLALVFCFLVGLLGAQTADADPPPFDGVMWFLAIQDTSGPEDFSWKVHLAEDQALEQIDERSAIVYYVDDHTTGFSIFAEAAHDVIGTSVPTSLSVTGSDVITLTVHHRAGNPKTGGTPFDYPINSGQGWEVVYVPAVQVIGPPDEAELREQREREAREGWEALEARGLKGASGSCVVPRLRGKSLKASRRRLASAGCKVGSVTFSQKGGSMRGARVVGQSPRPGIALNPHAAVDLQLK